MVTAGDIILNILVYMNIYWYLVPLLFVGAIYWVVVKIISFPLASNKGHEFIVMTRPESVSFQKVITKYYPFFTFKKGLYWFSEPCADVGSENKYHVFMEGINQSVSNLGKRRNAKLGDLMHNKTSIKQTKGHQVLIPKLIKQHLHRHYIMTIDKEHNIIEVKPTEKRQPFKISLYHTLGIYIQEPMKTKNLHTEYAPESMSGNVIEDEIENQDVYAVDSGDMQYYLKAVTAESIITELSAIQSHSYYSANTAFTVYKAMKNIETNFITWLKGATDPKIMATMIILMAAIAIPVIMMIFLKPDIGEMPTN